MRTARIPTQRVFKSSTEPSTGETRVIGTQKANVRWPNPPGTPRIHPHGRLIRYTVEPEVIAELATTKRPSYLTPFTPTSERTRDERGRFTSLPKKPTHSIATGRPLT